VKGEMIMLKNIKIGLRLTLGFSLVIVFMIVLIIIGVRQMASDHDNLERIVKENDTRIRLANNMVDNAREVALSVRGLLMRKSSNRPEASINEMRDEYDDKWRNYDQNNAEIKKLILNEDLIGQQLFLELQASADTARQLTAKAIEMAMAGDVNEATDFVFSTDYPSVKRWIKHNHDFILHNEEQSEIFYDEVQTGQERSRKTIFVVGTMAVVLTIMIIIFLTLGITRPLKISVDAANSIVLKDLTIDLSKYKNQRDETGLLLQSFSKMVGALREQIQGIMEGINTLTSSSSEILAATTQVASGAAETASAISETSATVEEVRQAAELSSQKASRVSENAQQVAQVTQTGKIAVEETVNVMHQIQIQMASIANTIVRLSEQSLQIGGIIASVNDVADQSNLLAVNAAIEAAKAGEQGKGFAVVAQEIKSLALQSKQATIQVRNILSEVQKTTSAAVMATEQGSKAVDNGVKQSTQAGESIRLISESVNESVLAATQIVASSQQQVVGMDQVGLAMNNINQAGEESAASMMQAETAAKGLHKLGQNLKHLVEQYKI
jgi:methyl-accepting chemotaxis protein